MAKNTIKEFGVRRANNEFTIWEAPGFVAILDSCGVSVRKFRRDNETGRWLAFNSLEQWIAHFETRGDVDMFVQNYVKGKMNEAKVD